MAAVLVAFGLSAGSVASAEGRGTACGCGPKVVAERGALVVLPTGRDDTRNLQCAIDRAGRLGIRKVRLVKGTYYTGQIVARNFVGHLFGAGAENTVVRNLQEPLYVTPENFYFEAPSADNPWPSLLAFVDGRFRVSDLTIRIVGATCADGLVDLRHFPRSRPWPTASPSSGREPRPRSRTSRSRARSCRRLRRTGSTSTTGSSSRASSARIPRRSRAPSPCATASSVVSVRERRLPTVKDAEVRILDNRFEDVPWGAEIIDVQDTRYSFLGNHVSASVVGLDQYDMCMSPSPRLRCRRTPCSPSPGTTSRGRACTWRGRWGAACGAPSSRTTSRRT